jgi:hypothetical protein
MNDSKWHWPLPGIDWQGFEPGYYGSFGAVRKHDRHTGIDLYCPIGQMVEAVEDGTVVGIEWFTGPDAGSPWWAATQAILVEGASGVVLYGELHPADNLQVGSKVLAGQTLGNIILVIKKERQFPPRSMLHLELYRPGTTTATWWKLDEPQPDHLLDPTACLLRAVGRDDLEICRKALSRFDTRREFLWLLAISDHEDSCCHFGYLSQVVPAHISRLAFKLACSQWPGGRYAGNQKYWKAWNRLLRLGKKSCPELMLEAASKARFVVEVLDDRQLWSEYISQTSSNG